MAVYDNQDPERLDIDFERLFRRGGGNGASTSFRTPAWAGKPLAMVLVLVGLLVLLRVAVGIYTDWLWFNSLGFAGVYVTRMTVQIGTFVGFGVVFLALLAGNVWLARWITSHAVVTAADEPRLPEKLVRLCWALVIGIQALIMAGVA